MGDAFDADELRFNRQDFDLSPGDFHELVAEPGGRRMWVPRPVATRTLVLGSAQKQSDIDAARCAAEGVDVIRRRSGGGAVLASQYDVVWFDVLIDRSDPLWVEDVGRASHWIGDATAAALARFGIEAETHKGPMVHTERSAAICFAGLGPGELTVAADGAGSLRVEGRNRRKIVGISQRRTRQVARFQVAILRRWSGPEHAALLSLDDSDRPAVAAALHPLAAGVTADPDELLGAIQDALSEVDPVRGASTCEPTRGTG